MLAKDLINFCKDGNLKVVKTAPGRNGNREGVSSSGYLAALKNLPKEWKVA